MRVTGLKAVEAERAELVERLQQNKLIIQKLKVRFSNAE